jgi:hypothetical protein
MAFEAKIVVALDEELPIYRTMRAMANRATFAHCFVLENKRPALFAMTLRARFVKPRHRKPARPLHYVMAMRVMAVDAIHVSFDHGMMLRQIEFRMDVDVTLETRRRIFAWIDNQAPPAADAHMFAGGAVARFATGHLRELDVILVKAPMRAGWKRACDVRVTIHTTRIPDEVRARNARRHIHGALQ